MEECEFWGLCIGKAGESFKWGLMGYPSRKMEASFAENDVNCADLTQEFSEKNIIVCSRACFFVKDVTVFGYCPKSLPEHKMTRFRLTAL